MDHEGNLRMEKSDSKAEQEEQEETLMFVRTLQEFSRSMGTVEERKVREDPSETNMANEKECMYTYAMSLLFDFYFFIFIFIKFIIYLDIYALFCDLLPAFPSS